MPRLEPLENRTVLSTFSVLNGLDSGPGSLRQAIIDANAAPGQDTIVFARSVRQVRLTTGELSIDDDLIIQGPAANRLTISGQDLSRVFNVQAESSVTIAGLTIAQGRADGDAADMPGAGGGILNRGDLTLDRVVLAGNQAVGDPNVVVSVNPSSTSPAVRPAVPSRISGPCSSAPAPSAATGPWAPTMSTAPGPISPGPPSPAMGSGAGSAIMRRRRS